MWLKILLKCHLDEKHFEVVKKTFYILRITTGDWGILIKTKHNTYLMNETLQCTVVFLKISITLTTPVCITV